MSTFFWKLFRPSTLDPLSVSMVGVKLADRVLVVGCRDPLLIAALAIKAGLTGRTCAIDRMEGLVREAERVALSEGALVEFKADAIVPLPYDSDSFDVVVLRDVVRGVDAPNPHALAAECLRALRKGGRCMVIDGLGPVKSWMWERTTPPNREAEKVMTDAMTSAGFVAVRTLAERNGVLFLEAVKRAS